MKIYKGEKSAILMKQNRSIVELYKGEKKLFGYNASKTGETIKPENVHPIEHQMKVRVVRKNLLPRHAVSQTLGGIEFTVQEDGSILVNGTATENVLFQVAEIDLEKGTYRLSGCPKLNNSSVECCLYYLCPEANAYGFDTGTGQVLAPKTQTTAKIYIRINPQKICDNLIFYPMLTRGVTKENYSPYVTDLEKLKVDKTGKNLFKTTNYSKGSILVADGSVHTGTAKYIETSDYIPLKAGTYTISYKKGANLRYVCLFNQEKEVTGNFWSSRKNPYTFTIDEDCLVRIDIERANNVAIDNYDTFFADFEVQLEPGKVATAYEEYKGVTYNPTAEGTVEGVTSIYPNMTLISYTPGVVIECEYVSDG